MRIEKRTFRIGELAEQLAVERFVIRFWEREFAIRARRSPGGQRFYDERDLKKFSTIKELLYERGFTIAGAKKHLKNVRTLKQIEKVLDQKIVASHITTMEPEVLSAHPKSSDTLQQTRSQLKDIKIKLIQLRELL